MRAVRLAWLVILLAAAVDPAAAQAPPAPGGLAIAPLRVDLHAAQRGGAVTLTNSGDTRKTLQVEIYDWTQTAEDDVYAPTRDLVVNPPLFFIEPGASQVVRVGRSAADGSAVSVERAFRVYFREVPEGDAPAGDVLRVMLRIGIPVFVIPEHVAPAQLAWSGIIHKDGSAELFVDNSGGMHARPAEVKLLATQGAQVLAHADGFRYVLPGSRQHWHLPKGSGLTPGPARVATLLEEGAREFPLALRAD